MNNKQVVVGLLLASLVGVAPAQNLAWGAQTAQNLTGPGVFGRGLLAEVKKSKQFPLLATAQTQVANDKVAEAQDSQQPTVLALTLADAIKIGLEHNPDIAAIKIDQEFRDLDQDKAKYYSDLQKDADEQVADGWDAYSQFKTLVNSIPDGGTLPMDVSADGNIIPRGTPKAALQTMLAQKEAELLAADQYSIDTLEEAETAYLIQEKARVGVAVTKLGEKVAEKAVAVGIQKAYYDVLKAQYLEQVKKTAYQRAQSQYDLANVAYEAGMRAKDDMLMAHVQAQLMQADWEKAKSDVQVANLELKKIMGLAPSQQIELKDDFTTEPLQVNLEQDLAGALQKRLEIKKAQGELDVYQLDAELANRYQAPNTFDAREASLNVKKAENELAKEKLAVETEVRESYANLLATKSMLQYIDSSKQEAQESVDIATYRYQEGYVFTTGTLKSINAEDSAGTIIEVLAAQEKLADVEEKAVSIIYGYNLARSKYLLDIGDGL